MECFIAVLSFLPGVIEWENIIMQLYIFIDAIIAQWYSCERVDKIYISHLKA
jgi:hypothetical protein